MDHWNCGNTFLWADIVQELDRILSQKNYELAERAVLVRGPAGPERVQLWKMRTAFQFD